MKKRYYFLSVILFAFFLVIFLYHKKSSMDMTTVSTEIVMDASLLTEAFISNEKEANTLYKNKVIEIKGTIKTINFKNNKKTILLYSNYKNYYVICEMKIDLDEKKAKSMMNTEVIIKGICKGFLHDVIMLNCVLINKKNNE